MIETEIGFGPSIYNCNLHIDEAFSWDTTQPLVIDIETDEKDNFVGLAVMQITRPDHVFYFTRLKDPVKQALESMPIIGQNIKGDMKWLINWGVKLKSSQLFYDTMLASYVQNTTKESHGLKDLAKEYLGLSWPTYREMVGTGRNKRTLNEQPVEQVAKYCGMDCLATYRLYEYFKKKLTANENKYLEEIELPTARALLDMELRGVQVDVEYLKELDAKFECKLLNLENEIQLQWKNKEELNINSNRQIARLLNDQGATLPMTKKGNLKVDKATLEQWKHLPAVPLLLEYSKIEKLKSTYTEALLEKQKNGKIYCQFNQLSKDSKGNSVGISTGRLSSSNPNLQNIPVRTEEGKQLRKAFIPGNDKIFFDADFSQIEYILLTEITQEPILLDAYKNNKDLHEETAKTVLKKQVVTDAERNLGKTLNFSVVYGSQADNIAVKIKSTRYEAQKFLDEYFRRMPKVSAWITRVKWEARQRKGVMTMFGRWIPLPKINEGNKYERAHWERVAVNSIIQGSAAEILKKSLIVLNEAGYSTVLTVHDEFLIEIEHPQDELRIKEILENIVKLSVPLKVDVGIGQNWLEAKE